MDSNPPQDAGGADGDAPRPRHSIADHQLGAGLAHQHGDDADHDHDHDFGGPVGDDPTLWMQDNVVLNTVGIDIGSAGTQVGFSRLHLQRISEQLSTRYVVISREPLYQSPSILTPYRSETEIDAAALGQIIDSCYDSAGLHPDVIDAGAVILTGEALRRDNAQNIAEVLAEQGGEFVCATAGHHMECTLAVYGSGAARRSFEQGQRILNIDIGGGTTKLGVVDKGELESTAAIHLGGRLLVVDEQDRIIRLDPAGRVHARNAGFDWQVGSIARRADLARVAAGMADALVRVLKRRFTLDDLRHLLLTEALEVAGEIDGMMFSGGVGEYVYDREPRDFGDLGKLFGRAIRERIAAGALPWPLLPAGECMRATVLGASEYSVQLSGNTTFISDPATLLPRKALQVVPLGLPLDASIDPRQVQRALQRAFVRHDLSEGDQDVAISIQWSGAPRFQRMSALAEGLLLALPRTLSAGRPLYVVTDGDIAHTLGHLLKGDPRVKSEVLVIDGITLWGFDYIDLGRIRVPSLTVPVTVKSLVFSEDPCAHGKQDPADWHHHGDGVPHRHGHAHGHHHHHHGGGHD
ncbi:MAG: ethanolamine ammonia-lyase reactivating factor EutA [Burkholderiaceae bacterium]|jgi:ethanolamine utilization protein EutA|nr:ethanolamine ammonia-lyase reactivating factor EutA [Burkholderiaceae bacterium]